MKTTGQLELMSVSGCLANKVLRMNLFGAWLMNKSIAGVIIRYNVTIVGPLSVVTVLLP